MSPGVATPCPAAPPIPIAKVCFIAPSQAECGRSTALPALGRAQIKVRIPAIESPPPNDRLALSRSRSIHPILPCVVVNWGLERSNSGYHKSQRVSEAQSPQFFLYFSSRPKLSLPLPIGGLFLGPPKALAAAPDSEFPASNAGGYMSTRIGLRSAVCGARFLRESREPALHVLLLLGTGHGQIVTQLVFSL